jgi:hypothetical protein
MEMDAELDMEEPAGDDLPAAEELVQDLMGVLEKHFEDVEFNVEVEGGEEMPMDEPAMEMPEDEPEMDLEEPAMDEPPMDEEEPMMETDLEEEALGTGLADGMAQQAEVAADEDAMEEETLEEEELEEMEGGDAHSKLIDAIAAKVAERLLAEAKKTNE